MQNAEFINNIMQRLGNRRSPELRLTVVTELNEKIRELEMGPNPAWFLETYVTGNMTPLQPYVTTPTNFIREVEEGVLKVQDVEGGWHRLFKVPLERLEAETADSLPAMPEGYALFGSQFRLGPTPDIAYAYTIPCYIRTMPIVDNTQEASSPWIINFMNYISLETIDIVARTHIQSAEIPSKIADQLSKARDYYWRAVEARKHANMDYLLGDEE